MLRWSSLLCLLFMTIAISGCGYGEVSPTTYELAKSLYNITNRRLDGHLDKVHSQIVASEKLGDISQREAKWLLDIYDDAKNGKWQVAMLSSRRLLEDQVQK